MNQKELAIYLNDHLALIVGELELLKRVHKENEKEPLGVLLSRLLAETSQQEAALRVLLERVDVAENRLKQAAAWLAEKAGRFKLNGAVTEYSDLSRLVEVEALVVAAMSRVNLWATLSETLSHDEQFRGGNFDHLADQAKRHADELHQQRKAAASRALRA